MVDPHSVAMLGIGLKNILITLMPVIAKDGGRLLCFALIKLEPVAFLVQSGAASATWVTVPSHKARKRAFALGKLVGCRRETSQELLKCLQGVKNFNTIIENQQEKVWSQSA